MMIYILLFVFLILLFIILFFVNYNLSNKISAINDKTQANIINSNLEIDQKNQQLSEKISLQFADLQIKLLQQIFDSNQNLNKNLDYKLMQMNNKVEERIETGYINSNKLFLNIIENLHKIDAAQKNIESLSSEVISLQDILSGNKKARGIFGEVQLSHILYAVFGETNDNNKIYQLEYTMKANQKRCDAILFAPQPLGNIAIDAKFPLENYQKLQDYKITESERKEYEKIFKDDIKKHIDKIANSYIIAGETSDHGIMFIPAEGIFSYVHAYCSDIIFYASSKKIWITAPSTLMATLSTIQIILREKEQQKNFAQIQIYLRKLGDDFQRYDQRWKDLMRNLNKVHATAESIEISSNKIYKQFQQITN